MKQKLLKILLILLGLSTPPHFPVFSAPAAPDAGDPAFKEWWSASGAEHRRKAAQTILKSNLSFDEIFKRLRSGPVYSAQVPTGRRQASRNGPRGARFHYSWYVPPSYQPDRPCPAEFYLHGGVARPPFAAHEKWWAYEEVLFKEDRIAVFPAAWMDAMWWQESQLDNLEAIRDILKQTYNMDENRMYIAGFSDGGTGAYYIAARRPTPWAAFLPLIGHAAVLANPDSGAEGDFYPVNLANRPFFIVNCGRDPLYPVSSVEPFIRLFQKAGCPIVFHPQPENGHDHYWWPAEGPHMERFKRANPRNPYPERLVWETDNPETCGRIHWLIIDQLGASADEPPAPDINRLKSGNRESNPVFPRRKPFGRVDAERKNNQITVRAWGIRALTLLLSPDCFDFSQPFQVTLNGAEVFAGNIARDAGTLLKWAARDNDRTMLFAAELPLTVAGKQGKKESGNGPGRGSPDTAPNRRHINEPGDL